MARCELCRSSRDDADQYGELLSKGGMSVHTFCLYLSSNLPQRGEDHEGFLGFLPKDIKAERKRVESIRCCYCGCMNANVGCCWQKCRRNFHTICGIEHGAKNQFFGTYQSYCNRHVRKFSYRPSLNELCCICYEQLRDADKRFNSVQMLLAFCCRNGWFHKLCLQRFANTAGYFFKCPLCNNSDVFRRKVAFDGIFIPDRDAAWELEPNAYGELLERPNRCSAEHCHSAARRAGADDTLLLCETCGSVAMHRRCMPNARSRFQCGNCRQLLSADSGRESMQSVQEEEKSNANEEDIELDVCELSDSETETADRDAVKDTVTQLPGEEQQQQQVEDEVDSDVGKAQVARMRNRHVNRIRSSDDEDSDAAVMERKRKKCKRKTPLKTRKPPDADDTSKDDEEVSQFESNKLAKTSGDDNGEGGVCNAVIKHNVPDDIGSDSDDPLESFGIIMDRLQARSRNVDKRVKVIMQSNQAGRAATPENIRRHMGAETSNFIIMEDSADKIDGSLDKSSRCQMASSLERQTSCTVEQAQTVTKNNAETKYESDKSTESSSKLSLTHANDTSSGISTFPIRKQVVVKLKKLSIGKSVSSATPAKRPRMSSTDDSQSLHNVSCIARRTRRRSKPLTNVEPSSNSAPNMSFIAQRTRRKSTTKQTPSNYAEKTDTEDDGADSESSASIDFDGDSDTEDAKATVSENDCTSSNSSVSSMRTSSILSFYSCSSTPSTTTTSTTVSTASEKRKPVAAADKRWPCTSTQHRLASSEAHSSLSSATSTHRTSTRFAANLHCLHNKFDAYLRPKFARIDGKLRRITDDDPLKENQAVHSKFVRSCGLLLNTNSENQQRQLEDQRQTHHRPRRHGAHALHSDCKSL